MSLRTLADLWRQSVYQFAHRKCLGASTYHALQMRVETLQSQLQSFGIRPYQRVMMIPHKTLDTLALFFATWSVGAVVVPVPTLDPAFISRVKPYLITHFTPTTPQTPILTRTSFEPSTFHTPSLSSSSSPPALILFTSGTTDKPKGVVLSHDAIWTNIENVDSVFHHDVNDQDSSFSLLPWYHCYALVNELLYAVYKGLQVHVPSSDHPKTMFREMKWAQPSIVFTVPMMLTHILNFHQQYPYIPIILKKQILFGNRLRFLCVGGSPCHPDRICAFSETFHIPIVQGYGLTESSPMVSLQSLADARDINISCGKVLPSIDLFIEPSTSEIFIKGRQMMLGYLEDCETVDHLTWTPCPPSFPTGDKGMIDGYGNLHVQGRCKNEYKLTNGKYIDPVYVESCLQQCPLITQIVIGPSQHHDHTVAIVYTEHTHQAVQTAMSKLADQHHLTSYERPTEIIFLETPMTVANQQLSLKLEPRRQFIFDALYGGTLSRRSL